MDELAKFYRKNKYLVWKSWESFAFFLFSLSTIFMVLFSVPAVQKWPVPWNQLSILIACTIPLLLVLIQKIPEWIKNREIPIEIVLIGIILVLGISSAAFSEDRWGTMKGMGLFFLSGIMVFLTTYHLLNSKLKQTIFLWVFFGCYVVFCSYGFYHFFSGGKIWLFTDVLQQAGSIIILLLAGPLILIARTKGRLGYSIFAICLLIGGILIFLIGRKGPLLSLVVMIMFFGLLHKKFWIYCLVFLLMLGLVFQFKDKIPSLYKVHFSRPNSVFIRLENYSLAYHVFKKKPLFGKGLYTPLLPYLSDYKGVYYNENLKLNPKTTKGISYKSFYNDVRDNKTFANIILCLFVEMGSIFAITYIGLVSYILIKFLRYIRDKPELRLHAILLLTPLVGFFVHSMTFDSLKYPDLNWMFHSLLGLMANFDKFHSKE